MLYTLQLPSTIQFQARTWLIANTYLIYIRCSVPGKTYNTLSFLVDTFWQRLLFSSDPFQPPPGTFLLISRCRVCMRINLLYLILSKGSGFSLRFCTIKQTKGTKYKCNNLWPASLIGNVITHKASKLYSVPNNTHIATLWWGLWEALKHIIKGGFVVALCLGIVHAA